MADESERVARVWKRLRINGAVVGSTDGTVPSNGYSSVTIPVRRMTIVSSDAFTRDELARRHVRRGAKLFNDVPITPNTNDRPVALRASAPIRAPIATTATPRRSWIWPVPQKCWTVF